MFRSLIRAIQEAVLKPHTLSPEAIARAHDQLAQIRRDSGHPAKADVKTKRKTLLKLPKHLRR